MLAEAHATPGGIQTHVDIQNTRSWWAPGTAARAGVGIILHNRFLDKFMSAPPNWVILDPGRLAVLQLKGNSGSLDILVGYFPTGTRRSVAADLTPNSTSDDSETALRRQREALARKIRHYMRSSGALIIVAGDFNFVTNKQDRMQLNTGEFSGDKDTAEAKHWDSLFPKEVLYELT